MALSFAASSADAAVEGAAAQPLPAPHRRNAQPLISSSKPEMSAVDPNTLYYQKKFHMIVLAIVLVGSINWLAVGITGKDLVHCVLPLRWAKWVYILVGIAGAGLLFQRDVYLPFLGETLVPAEALVLNIPKNANEHVTITTVPGAKVLYWAAEQAAGAGPAASWDVAYGAYSNAGVAVADARGKALLRFRGPPQSYKVPTRGELQPHVHFRIAEGNGFMGRVQTIFLGDGHIEGFADIL